MRFALPTVLIWLLTIPLSQANCWRKITPLHSTCDDVKKVLSIEACSMPITNYNQPELQVMISFATGDCDKTPRGWRVPKGTVTAIILSPKIPMTPATFGLDLSKYEKREDGEIVGLDHYTSVDEGVTVDIYNGVIHNLFLYPRKADEVLRCKPPDKTEARPDGDRH
jgi:hypothetical protein